MNSHVHIGRAARAAHTQAKVQTPNIAATGRPMAGLPTGQQGFSLVTAIFVLVVLAGLGSYMVSISGTQHYTTLHALQGVKAYHAARSGIEWGASQVSNTSACSSTNFNLDDFTVDVTCQNDGAYNESGNDVHIFTITAIAATGTIGNPNYAARQITATVATQP